MDTKLEAIRPVLIATLQRLNDIEERLLDFDRELDSTEDHELYADYEQLRHAFDEVLGRVGLKLAQYSYRSVIVDKHTLKVVARYDGED